MDQSTLNKLKVAVSNWATINQHEMSIYLFKPLLKQDSDKAIDLAIIFSSNLSEDHQIMLWDDFHHQWEQELSEEFSGPILLHRCIPSRDPGLEKHLKEKGELIF